MKPVKVACRLLRSIFAQNFGFHGGTSRMHWLLS